MKKPKAIDEYVAPLSADKRAALQRVRKIIHAAAPRAEECISYGLPAFRANGRTFIWFGAAKNHCAIYGPVDESLKADLKDYDKGTIRFPPNDPLPATLIRKLVKARLAKTRRSTARK